MAPIKGLSAVAGFACQLYTILSLMVLPIEAENPVSRVHDIPQFGLGTWLSDREKVPEPQSIPPLLS